MSRYQARIDPVLNSAEVVLLLTTIVHYTRICVDCRFIRSLSTARPPQIFQWQHDLAESSERYQGECMKATPGILLPIVAGGKFVTISAARRKE